MQEKDMKLEDWLDDLCVRFIINLPQEELISVERICFQVEEAQWFYEDFIRPLDPLLPSLSLKEFSMKIFAHCPLMSQWSPYHHAAAFSEFMAYKTRVPVRGAILLNEEMDKCVLVKGYKKNANWSFPRGKINKDEPDLDCAIREVYEETGFDIREAGLLTGTTEDEYIEIPMREQNMRLYVIRGVSMDTHFEPRTRKEISRIDWCKISDLPAAKRGKKQQQGNSPNQSQSQTDNHHPQQQEHHGPIPPNKFYMVAPFLSRLKRIIRDHKRNDEKLKGGDASNVQYPSGTEAFTEEEDLPIPARKRKTGAAKTPALSEVPEARTPLEITAAASPHGDPMATLKQVLNISGGTPAGEEKKEPVPPADEGDKSKTLLGLLKSASVSTTDTPPVSTTQPPVSVGIDHANAPQSLPPPQQPILPPQAYSYLPHPPPLSTAPPLHPSFMPPAVPPGQPLSNPLHPSFPPMLPPPHLYNTTIPQPYMPYPASTFPHSSMAPPPPPPPPHHPNPLLPFSHAPQPPQLLVQEGAPAQGPASRPYQRTGDPQFAQTEQQRGKGGFASAIPSASKLPPPKLNRHSLGLLSVLRGEAAAATTAATAAQDKELEKKNETGLEGKTSTGNAAGDLLKLLKRKPAPAPAPAAASASVSTSAVGVPTSAGAMFSVTGNVNKQQKDARGQTEKETLPIRQHDGSADGSRRQKPQQTQPQLRQQFRGGRSAVGSETEFSDSGRRNGRGGRRAGGLKTASTPDLGKRGRRDQEKEREREKMKNVTILSRPQPQQQTTSQEGKKATPPASAPQQPRKHYQQQPSPRNKPQPFQPQRILKRPDSTGPTGAAKPAGLNSSRLPGETIEVRAFGKPAKYGRPAVPAEPVKVGEVPKVIERRRIPTSDNEKEDEVEKVKTTVLPARQTKQNEQKEGGEEAVTAEQKQSKTAGKDQEEVLLGLFTKGGDDDKSELVKASEPPQRRHVKEEPLPVNDAAASAPISPPVADSKAFLLGYLNSVASQGGRT